jgi:hypothetical protein
LVGPAREELVDLTFGGAELVGPARNSPPWPAAASRVGPHSRGGRAGRGEREGGRRGRRRGEDGWLPATSAGGGCAAGVGVTHREEEEEGVERKVGEEDKWNGNFTKALCNVIVTSYAANQTRCCASQA